MGQQQLLLVILVTIIVGIATVVAINIFGTAAEQANKDAIRQDLLAASAQAQGIWARPEMMGGVGGEFDNDVLDDDDFLQLLGMPGTSSTTYDWENENAGYDITRAPLILTIEATPKGSSGDWTMTVTRNTGATATSSWTVEIIDGDGNISRIGQDNT